MEKYFPAILITAAITFEAVVSYRHEEAPPPHIEPELKVSTLGHLVQSSPGGGNVSTEPLGRFRWITFYRKMRRLSLKKGEEQRVAMLEAYFETALAIMERYPDLKIWERQHQYNCFKHEINLTTLRTHGCKDYSSALPVVAKTLGLPEVCLGPSRIASASA
ncbi:MAG: hypothetical protein WAL95_03075 [Candidatus Acidiferrales bacterium]